MIAARHALAAFRANWRDPAFWTEVPEFGTFPPVVPVLDVSWWDSSFERRRRIHDGTTTDADRAAVADERLIRLDETPAWLGHV